MIPKRFSGLSILLILALLISSFAVVMPATPVQAAVTSVTVSIPSTSVPIYGHTGGMSPAFSFIVNTDATTNGDVRLEVLTHGTTNSVATNDITNVALPVNGANPFTSYQVNLTGVAAGTYDVRVSALQPTGSGTRIYSTVVSNALIVDNTVPAVTLTNPNGGQFVSANSNYTVYFTVTDAIPNVTNVTVSALYSTDGGSTYPYTAFGDTSVSKGSSSVQWLVANMPTFDTASARLQLTVTDAAGNSTVVRSASNFTIIDTYPTVVVQQPTGTSSWNGASAQTIQFTTTTGLSVAQDYLIEFWNGLAWSTVKDWSASITATAGLTNYSWTADNTYRGSAAKIRVTPKDKAGNIGSTVESAAFTIVDVTVPIVTVTAPLAGTKFYSGITATGTASSPVWSWVGTDNVLSLVGVAQTLDYDVYYTTDGTNYTLISSPTNVAQGIDDTLTWAVPSILASSSNCKLKIIAKDHATVPNISAGSLSPTFSILLPGTVTVTNLVPNGAQSWQVGTTQSITWTATDSSDTAARLNYVIKLSTDGGATYPTTIATLTNQATGARTYSWSVPNNVGTTNKIQITASNPASGVTGTAVASSGNFSITTADFDVTTATIDLHQGWNLISLPIIPTNTNIENILAGCIGRIDRVWACTGGPTGGTWSSYYPGGPTSLTTMADGKGYWIKVTAGADTLFTYQGRKGAVPPATLPVYNTVAGWNLVGLTSTVNTHTIETYFYGTNYALPVYGFTNTGLNSGTYDIYTPETDTLDSEKGYWLYTTGTGTFRATGN